MYLVFSHLFAGCGDQHIKVAEARACRANGWLWHFQWSIVSDQQFMEEANMLSDILKDVTSAKDRSDFWIWTLDHSKLFLVASYYNYLMHSLLGPAFGGEHIFVFKEIWNTVVSSKIHIFGWRLFSYSLSIFQCHVIFIDEPAALCPFCKEVRGARRLISSATQLQFR